MSVQGTCECGTVTIEATSLPPMRFFCHCRFCQEVYQAPFADITALWSWKVDVAEGADQLEHRRYQWFPSSVLRILCRQCRKPVLGRLHVPPFGVSFVPAAMWPDADDLPPASGHVFYHRRVVDIDDDLSKASSLSTSQMKVTAWMLPRLLRGR